MTHLVHRGRQTPRQALAQAIEAARADPHAPGTVLLPLHVAEAIRAELAPRRWPPGWWIVPSIVGGLAVWLAIAITWAITWALVS